jgi:glucose/arabinose dehydrogenase
LLARLSVPAGFKASVWARDAGNVRWMQVAPNGDVYVSRREQGDVMLLRGTDAQGRVAERRIVAQNLKWVHGLALRGGQLYMATDKKVLAAAVLPDGALGEPRVLIDDLPDAGQHPNRTLAFGPDGLLYITVGSTCNDCRESNPEAATIVQAQPDGRARSVFARGLRNTIGFGWHPATGVMYGMDHGADYHGDDWPPEELNALMQGKHYGWPFCYERRVVDSRQFNDPPHSTKRDFCPTTEPSVLTYTAHAAPIGMVFYPGAQFPAEFRNDAFVAMRGSWNRGQPSGYKVVRVRFDAAGRPVAFEDFISGWLMAGPADTHARPGPAAGEAERRQAQRPSQFGRLAGLAVAADGSLLVAEDQNGVIYRIQYQGR